MTIIQMETFLSIEKTGSFSGAANELGYAQSTVTMQMKQLEEELGCLLFDRLGKKVVLTAEGERLLKYAEKMLEIEREIRLSVPEGPEPAGVLRLGISESLCYKVLPSVLMEYKKTCPKVSMEIQFILHDNFPGMLKNGALDLVFTLNPLIESEELKLLYKKDETLGFYASPDDPLSKRSKVKEEDLDGVPLLLTSHKCSFRTMLFADLERKGITPKTALEITNKGILKQFARNGLGVAFIPDMVAEDELKEGTLKRLKWKGEDFPICSQIFVHKDKHISHAIKAFVDIAAGV